MTIPPSAPGEPIDLEVWSQRNERPPGGRRYRIRVDREYYVVDVGAMTAEAILNLAGKSSTSHRLYQKHRGQEPQLLNPTTLVDFTAPGIERFQTIPIDPTDGLELRRDFNLLPEDAQALKERGLAYETVIQGGEHWVIMHSYALPNGYNETKVNAALLLPTTYPDAQIDMVFFNPPVARVDGKPIHAATERALDSRAFQQWSRHRTPANPWRVGIDNLGTHLLMVDHWLEKELSR